MIAEDETLAGYQAIHGRAPAFAGPDGRAYSVGVFSDDEPDGDGSFGASLLFIRWSDDQQPEGHLESAYLARAADAADAEAAVARMRLDEVKAVLDALIAQQGAS